MTSDDYPVGYGKPPKHTQFRPGQSGNPKGRPKGTRNLATDIEEELSERILVTEGGRQTQTTKQRAMIKSLTAKALKGDVRAIGILLRQIAELEKNPIAPIERETLSKDDQAILNNFRTQLIDELKSSSREDKI